MSATVFTKENVNIVDLSGNFRAEAINLKVKVLNRLSGFSCIRYFTPHVFGGKCAINQVDIDRIITELIEITDPHWWIVNKNLDYTIESILVQNDGPYRALAEFIKRQ
jgi:hypothetical protein